MKVVRSNGEFIVKISDEALVHKSEFRDGILTDENIKKEADMRQLNDVIEELKKSMLNMGYQVEVTGNLEITIEDE